MRSCNWTASDILTMVREAGIFPRVLAGNEAGTAARLAKQVLKPLADRPVGNRIVRRTDYGNNSRYTLSEGLL